MKYMIAIFLLISCSLQYVQEVVPEPGVDYVGITHDEYNFIQSRTDMPGGFPGEELIYIDYEYLPIIVFHLREYAEGNPVYEFGYNKCRFNSVPGEKYNTNCWECKRYG